jgi:hypothetical protein
VRKSGILFRADGGRKLLTLRRLRRRGDVRIASELADGVLICTPFSFRSLCQTCSDEFRTIRKREGATRAAAIASGQRRVLLARRQEEFG